MLGIEHYWVFLMSGLLLNITPGSDSLYIFGRSISQGKSAGMMSVFGIISGAGMHTLFAAFGLSAILMHSALAFNLIKWIGAAYLVYLGVRSIMSKDKLTLEAGEMRKEGLRKVYFQGFLTNLFNPKVALFYLAFMPQFVSADNTYGSLPFLLLGLTFITTGTLWCSLIVVVSNLLTQKIRQSNAGKYLSRVTGVIFIGLGLKLLGSGRT
ncbi:MAG: LysE family translocator [Paenibacillaceae bacterium]|jgi:threonine/homoserine/homoserine lactone efflux protein|nr:LysE family translocator [Paenibacillaceae bacterium]